MAGFLTRIAEIFSHDQEMYHFRDFLAGLDDIWLRDASQIGKDVFRSFMNRELQENKQYTKKELVGVVSVGMGLAVDAQKRQDLEQEEYPFSESALQKASAVCSDFRPPANIMVSAALERSASMHIGQKRITAGRFLGNDCPVGVTVNKNAQPS